MGRQSKNGAGNRRTDILDGFAYWWEDLSHNYQEKKELSKKPMGKQKVLDNSSNSGHSSSDRRISVRSKRNRLADMAHKSLSGIKSFFAKSIDNVKVFVYNVYCSIHKRKDNIMSKDKDNNTTPTNKGKNSKKAEKKEMNWFLSGIITIGIAVAWVSAAYCVVLVNTGTGDDMFPKYASAPLGLLLAGTFLVAIYKTIKNNNR